jgi:hypothetical protein
MTDDIQVRNLALNTQTSYVQQVSLFARYFNKSPEQLGPEDIRTYQVYLTNEKKLAPGSVLIAVAALRFLYKTCLKRDWPFEDVIPAPKKPQTLPVVLRPEEVLQFLGCVGHQAAGPSFCTEKPDPGDVDGYWVEPDDSVYDRIDPYWIDFEVILVPNVGKWKWRMLSFNVSPSRSQSKMPFRSTVRCGATNLLQSFGRYAEND